jgi:hypothetical protein
MSRGIISVLLCMAFVIARHDYPSLLRMHGSSFVEVWAPASQAEVSTLSLNQSSRELRELRESRESRERLLSLQPEM